ncbi:MAG: dihydrofolate reductase family protein [Propionibacteriaceae bacterium]
MTRPRQTPVASPPRLVWSDSTEIGSRADPSRPLGSDIAQRRRRRAAARVGIERALEQAKATAREKGVTVMGGADTGQQYLRAGLLDKLSIHLIPVLFRQRHQDVRSPRRHARRARAWRDDPDPGSHPPALPGRQEDGRLATSEAK